MYSENLIRNSFLVLNYILSISVVTYELQLKLSFMLSVCLSWLQIYDCNNIVYY